MPHPVSRRRRRRLGLGLAAALLLVTPPTLVTLAESGPRSVAVAGAPDTAAGRAAFETVRQVLQHPRCQNCHVPGDAPLQFDAGLPNAQSVVRGPAGRGAPGLPCATCHGAKNRPASYGPAVPPGAPDWQLPPPETKMVFIGLSAPELCSRLKDVKQTGGKDLPAMLAHVRDVPLVQWGWSPGLGRAPVPVPHALFVERFQAWIDAGAPCPPR